MSSKSTLDDFLSILGSSKDSTQEVIINQAPFIISPLDFKQQKALVTTGLDGLIGVINFIHQLNKTIIDCTGNTAVRTTDRTLVALHIRRMLTDKPVEIDDKCIDINTLIKNATDWDGDDVLDVETDAFTISLAIPTLVKENKFLLACIEELKPLQEGGLGENISTMLAYEIPKFITKITFGEKEINFDSINIKEKIKIVNSLPAFVTSKISDFIRQVSEYDEKLLTLDDVVVELDSSFFE